MSVSTFSISDNMKNEYLDKELLILCRDVRGSEKIAGDKTQEINCTTSLITNQTINFLFGCPPRNDKTPSNFSNIDDSLAFMDEISTYLAVKNETNISNHIGDDIGEKRINNNITQLHSNNNISSILSYPSPKSSLSTSTSSSLITSHNHIIQSQTIIPENNLSKHLSIPPLPTSTSLQHQSLNNIYSPPHNDMIKPTVPTRKNETDALIDNKRKRNPFQTAKDQYEKEGGVISKLSNSHQTDNCTNSNNKTTHQKSSIIQNKNKDNKHELPVELQHCDKEMVEKIEGDILHHGQPVTFADIAGLEFAKNCVQELICWPMLRPDIFTGLRCLPKGLLLFGPPGTGKTLIGKAIAHQANATFFCISASSLTSKWIGEGEKAVKTLFEVAKYRQPAVVFIDEVDSLLCQRSAEENESSRRIKTEFLVQLDGAGTDANARVVVVGATNRPEELDEAARRRFVKRLYIPLPDEIGRKDMFYRLLCNQNSYHNLTSEDIDILVIKTCGFSGADVRSLCTEAAMGPVREIAVSMGSLSRMRAEDVPPISISHFQEALNAVSPSVSPTDLNRYIEWNNVYGSYKRIK